MIGGSARVRYAQAAQTRAPNHVAAIWHL